eukprot:TRINITY_DN101117_c0_g1_i1.p1 TRINITY_DN101117_c0_g1~~TRINITY_DN101117_c0_g1_i1.p1  ORF type:complete len:353 (-),score=61.06 TRINITY_DN101117_c0_g1_i1:34-1092(-)
MGLIPEWILNHLPDADNVFAYDTVKVVRILDRRLGFIFWTVQFFILIYMVVIVFIMNKAYQDTEKSAGWILTKVQQPQVSHLGMSWDVYDRITNPGESGAVFIPTRVVITRGQTQEDEYCESPIHPCKTGKDCNVGNPLVQKMECSNGFCMRRQWCPAENPNWPTSEVHYLEFNQVELWFQGFVHFHKFGRDVTTADEEVSVHYPQKGANTYKLRDLVRMTNYAEEEFIENGAVMTVSALFECNLDQDNCEVKIETANVDTQTGFNYVYNHVYFENGVRKRDSYRMFGIRILSFAVGLGGKTSFSQIILQLSSAIALFGTAELISDFWMSTMVPERKHYSEQKYIPAGGFAD